MCSALSCQAPEKLELQVKAENNLDKGALTAVSCRYMLQSLPECLSSSVITWDVAGEMLIIWGNAGRENRNPFLSILLGLAKIKMVLLFFICS